LAAADLQRPAAVEQLRVVGEQVGVPVYTDPTKVAPHRQVAKGAAVSVCRAAISQAKQSGRDVVILDTAGRLHVDDELMGELEEVRAEGMAQSILGMGDILQLVETAQQTFDADETAKLQAKMEKGQFTLDDFMSQMGQVKKLGPMSKVMGMIPGMSQMTKNMN